MDGSDKVIFQPYICGPLTELSPGEQVEAKKFYELIADTCQDVLGVRAFIPHEHYDPQKHANYTPAQVDKAEREQVCMNTSLLIVVAIAPSWGGGIEVEMAYRSHVPIIIICEREKLEQRKISRLLRGNPGVINIIQYDSKEDAIDKFRKMYPPASAKN